MDSRRDKSLSFTEEVYAAVRKVPAGRVATYGQIAAMVGRPRAARAVGNALRHCDDPTVPCHRVVNAAGRLADGFDYAGPIEQKTRLEQEGVEVAADYRVDLGEYG